MIGVSLTGEQWLWLLAVVGLFLIISLFAIYDAFHRNFPSANEKMLWIQVSVLVPFLGGIVYLLIGRKRGEKIQWK